MECVSSTGLPHGMRGAVLAAVVIMLLTAPRGTALAVVPEGVWLIDGRVAVQTFDCNGLLCGRVLWLLVPRDLQGQPRRDRNNPDPAMRERLVCGLTIFWGLGPDGSNHWRGGWFYNPDDGATYNVSAELRSTDLLVARVYAGVPLLGRTKILTRVAHGTSDGWC